MASVGNANPGTISGVGNANPSRISGVGVANPGVISSVGNAGGSQPYRSPYVYALPSAPQAPVYQSAPAPPRPPIAPKLDIAALNAQARAAAENAVNPFYTKRLNDFLAQQSVQRQQQQTQYDTNIKDIEDRLSQSLEQSGVKRTQTTEDVALNQQEIAQNADQFQTDAGQQFDESRLDLARATAAGGLTGGLGAQKQVQATVARNTQEERQTQKFQQAKAAQDLFKTRTFEDLAKTDELNKVTGEKGKKQSKFDFDSFIQNLGFSEQNTRNTLEQERLQRIGDEQRNQAKLQFNQYLAGIRDPAQLQAAVQTYGSLI